MPHNKKVEKQFVAYSHDRILHNKMYRTTDTHHINESHRCYVDQKPNPKESILYDSIFKYKNRKT